MDPMLPVLALSLILGGVIAFLIFGNYFRKQKLEVESLAHAELNDPNPKHKKTTSSRAHQSAPKKSQPRNHSHASDKVFPFSDLGFIYLLFQSFSWIIGIMCFYIYFFIQKV